jgi:hypothetical protein
MHKGMRTAIAGVACLAAVAALGACGDDDDDETGAGDADGNGEVTTVEGDLGELCDLKLQIDAADFQSPTYLEDVAGLVGEAQAVAPPELEEAFRTISDAYGNAAEDEAALESPEFVAASAEVAEATHTGCGWEQVDITNVEYAFEGVPDEVPAGVTSFLTTNEGEEPHVAVLMKVPDDLEDPASVLESPEPPAGTEVIGAAFGAPGDMAGFAADLEAGTYFMFCDIPVGGAEDGAPHFAEGMQRVFTVT